jgi:PadR family transcriptional regulator, regulatory protein PadR
MPRSTPDPRGFLPLPAVQFEILLSLHREPMHGYALIQDIRERSSGELQLATSSVYAAIGRLCDEGLLNDLGERGQSAGPARRFFGLTSLGREVARLEAERVQRLAVLARRLVLGHPRGQGAR